MDVELESGAKIRDIKREMGRIRQEEAATAASHRGRASPPPGSGTSRVGPLRLLRALRLDS